MAERTDRLVDQIRRRTYNQSFTDSATLSAQRGVQTQTIVEYLNEAQRTLRGLIYSVAPQVFIKTGNISTVVDQEAYSLPTDSFLGGQVLNVEYKYSDSDNDYRKLKQKTVHSRNSRSTGDPQTYIHFYNTILLNPIPSTARTNGIRVTYEFQIPDLDVRRAKVSSVDDGSNPTSITVTDNTFLDLAFGGSNDPEYISVVDKDGVQQMVDIPVTSYNSSSGVLTLGSFTPDSGEEIAANDYIVIGHNASTHSSFPDVCESYLVEYVRRELLEHKGHPLSRDASVKLQSLADQIVDMFADYNTDIYRILELDPERSLDD